MTGNSTKIRTIGGNSPVEVHRENAKMPDFRRVSVFGGFSERRISHIGDPTLSNRGPDFGIIDRVACRSTDYEVK